MALTLSGCVAVWGKSYNVILKNSEGMMIEWDPGLTGSTAIARIAEREAARYGRVVVPSEKQDASYPGIRQMYFKFVKP